MLLPTLDNFVKGDADLVLFFHFFKAAKSIFTNVNRCSGGRAVAQDQNECGTSYTILLLCGPNDKIKIPACSKMISLLHSVKILQYDKKKSEL